MVNISDPPSRTIVRAPEGRRRRRPSGEPPPLPRQIGRSGRWWLASGGVLVAVTLLLIHWPRTGPVIDAVDRAVLQSLSRLRSDELTAFFREVQQRIEHPWPAPFVILVQVGIVGTLVALRRFRHLLVLLGALLLASSLASVVSGLALRPRPDGVEILGEWRDSALPSRPVAWLSASLVGLGYVLLPAGRMRNRVKLASAGLVGLFVLAQLYLAVDHPTDIVVSVVLGFSIPVLFFRLLVPNDAYPVVYALHRQTAHLDVTGARGEAIRRAAGEQLGLLVVSVESRAPDTVSKKPL